MSILETIKKIFSPDPLAATLWVQPLSTPTEIAAAPVAEIEEFPVFLEKPGGRLHKMGRPTKYPFQKLKVGEFFRVHISKKGSLQTLCYYWGKKLGRVYASKSHGIYLLIKRVK